MNYGSSASAYQPALPDPAALAALRNALSAAPKELDRIAGLARAEAIAALCAFSARCGIALAEGALIEALRPDPAWDAPPTLHGPVAEGRLSHFWLPAGLVTEGAQVLVEWAHYGSAPFDAPFFDDHLRRARNHPVSRLYRWRTGLGALARLAPEAGPVLDGLVLHMSRCGSTMVAQALAAMPGHVVLSEPAPFDDLLQFCAARADIALETRIALMRGMVGALAGGRGGAVRRRLLKADSWHTGALPLLRAAFPDTPWVFLYRDPQAVLLSHERMPGLQTLPGSQAALVGVDEPSAVPGLDLTARVLAATCHKAADHAGVGGGIFVDYAEMPGAIGARILPHFGIDPDPQERAAMAGALSRDAKEPFKPFDPQERAARLSASPEVIAASERHLAAAVARLRGLNPHASGLCKSLK